MTWWFEDVARLKALFVESFYLKPARLMVHDDACFEPHHAGKRAHRRCLIIIASRLCLRQETIPHTEIVLAFRLIRVSLGSGLWPRD
jgi:hypothetical protein